MPIIAILFGLVLLVLLAKALFETAYGTLIILIGLLVGAFGYALKAGVWSCRNFTKLWTTAFCY